jgi:DNA-binding NarL/FixJ family response regulator
MLNGLDSLFRLEEDFQVVARCVDGVQAMEAVRQHRPDVLILDIRLPVKDGLQVLREMARENLMATRVVILTASIQEEQLLEALRLGVRGVVLKEMAPALLVQCVRKVHSGGQWIERDSARRALEKILERQAGARALGEFLTSREAQIVTLIAKGMRNKEIAEKLFISEGTVKIHLHNIYEKLGVDGRLALMRYTQEKGLV